MPEKCWLWRHWPLYFDTMFQATKVTRAQKKTVCFQENFMFVQRPTGGEFCPSHTHMQFWKIDDCQCVWSYEPQQDLSSSLSPCVPPFSVPAALSAGFFPPPPASLRPHDTYSVFVVSYVQARTSEPSSAWCPYPVKIRFVSGTQGRP